MTPERESIDDIIERVTVDAYGEVGHEAFLCAFDDEIDYDGNARRGLIAEVDPNGDRHHVALLELQVEPNNHFGQLVAAYRSWLGRILTLDLQPHRSRGRGQPYKSVSSAPHAGQTQAPHPDSR